MTPDLSDAQVQRLIEVLAGELDADNGQPGDRELLAVLEAEMSAVMGAVS